MTLTGQISRYLVMVARGSNGYLCTFLVLRNRKYFYSARIVLHFFGGP